MTWAKDLTIDHYYVLPGYPNVCILRQKINNYQDESKTLLKFEDSVKKEDFYMVDGSERKRTILLRMWVRRIRWKENPA